MGPRDPQPTTTVRRYSLSGIGAHSGTTRVNRQPGSGRLERLRPPSTQDGPARASLQADAYALGKSTTRVAWPRWSPGRGWPSYTRQKISRSSEPASSHAPSVARARAQVQRTAARWAAPAQRLHRSRPRRADVTLFGGACLMRARFPFQAWKASGSPGARPHLPRAVDLQQGDRLGPHGDADGPVGMELDGVGVGERRRRAVERPECGRALAA